MWRNRKLVRDVKMRHTIFMKRGFTLIELLVVMAILSVLTVIVTGTFTSSMRRGRDSRRKDDLRSVSNALETYYNDKGVYPTGVGGVMVGCGALDAEYCSWGGEFEDQYGTLYMVLIPEDPLETQRYYYVSGGTNYKLYAKMENTLDEGNGVDQAGYSGTNCGVSGTVLCTYGLSSTDTTPTP